MARAFRPIRFEAWPTRMFGAYAIWAIGEDGTRRQVGHGTPAHCIREAARRNAQIGDRELPGTGPTEDIRLIEATPGIQQHLKPDDWPRHRFGLPTERWSRLQGRVFWVTGAGTGYGQAIAIALATAGGTVYCSGRRSAPLANTAAEAVRLSAPGRIVALPLDITDPEAVSRAAGDIIAGQGVVDGLLNGAALPPPAAGPWPLHDCTPDQWHRLMATNVTGHWLASRAALNAVAGPMRIVFLTSEAGWAATTGVGPYNVSKAALNSLATSLAAECAGRYPERDVQINVLDPGEARTEMNQGSTESPYAIVPLALALLSHPPGGPTGRFFHRDGRHLSFLRVAAHEQPLL